MKKYYFDFCGTLIKEQTHQKIKFFCTEKRYFFYFLKVFVPKRLKIKFDCLYLRIFELHEEFSEWLVMNTTPAHSLTVLKRLVDAGHSVTVLTLADQAIVESYLSKRLHGSSIDVLGSTAENSFTALLKAEVIGKESETVFFTDSMVDMPAMQVASDVVISEFSTSALRKHARDHQYISVLDYE